MYFSNRPKQKNEIGTSRSISLEHFPSQIHWWEHDLRKLPGRFPYFPERRIDRTRCFWNVGSTISLTFLKKYTYLHLSMFSEPHKNICFVNICAHAWCHRLEASTCKIIEIQLKSVYFLYSVCISMLFALSNFISFLQRISMICMIQHEFTSLHRYSKSYYFIWKLKCFYSELEML